MAVYVDDMRRKWGRGVWSHLMADTHDELLSFVGILGMKEDWLQNAGTPREHFDITESRRAYALNLGAIPISYRESGHLVMAKRAGQRFDVYAHRLKELL